MKNNVITSAAFVIATIICACSCSNKSNDTTSETIVDLSVKSLSLERIDIIDSISSYNIESGINQGKIYILDKYLCTLDYYSSDGKKISSHLGIGNSKSETSIGRVAGHCFMPNGNLMMFNTSGRYMFYDKNLQFIDQFVINYNKRSQIPQYSDPYFYSQIYERLVCRSSDNNIYFNVELAAPDINNIVSGDDYLDNAANILEIDTETQQFGRLLAIGYPKSYYEKASTKRVLSTVNYDIDTKGNFYVMYEADSLIYVYDKDFNLSASYGIAGRQMDTNYPSVSSIKDFRQYYDETLENKGYYNWIEYDNGLVFRSYTKGSGSDNDGLQIYRENTLIADVNVPKGLKVMGYIAPYYYSYIISDEDNEKLYFYRFKL